MMPLVVFFSAGAQAGLFDDDEARKSIKSLTEKVEAQNKDNEARFIKLDESIKGLGIIQLLNQIEALNNELARLRGHIEVLTNQNEQLQKRQKDFYFDIDARLRPLEGGRVASIGGTGGTPPGGVANGVTIGLNSGVTPAAAGLVLADAAGAGNVTATTAGSAAPSAATSAANSAGEAAVRDKENRAYDVGSVAFRRGDFSAAMKAFQTFVTDFSQSQLVPNAVYWIGLAQFNLKDFREARATQESLIKRFPESGKAPDALLVIASAQMEMGDAGSARNSYEDIIAKYPQSDAAAKARTRLGGLRR